MTKSPSTVLRVILFALVMTGSIPAYAAHYSLNDAVSYALVHNPNLNAAHQAVLAAGADRKTAQGQRLPRLDLNYVVRRSNNPLDAFADKLMGRRVTMADFQPSALNDPTASDLYATSLSLTLPIYTGGLLAAEIESAKQAETATSNQYQRRHAVTIYQVKTAYYAVQAAQRGVTIANAAVAAARRHANTTARLLRDGRIVESDDLTARVYLAAIEGAREQARTNLDLASAQLALMMGLPQGESVQVDPWTEPQTASNIPPLEELQIRALANRRDLQGTQAMVNAAAAQVNAAKAAYKPRVSLMASSNWYDDRASLDNHSWSVAGVVQMNLFAGGSDRDRVSASRYRRERLVNEMTSQKQAVREQVRAAYMRLQETSRRLAIAKGNVGRAERAVHLVDVRYGQGRTILIELLQAEHSLVAAKQEALAAALGVKDSTTQLQLADGDLATAGKGNAP